MDPRKTSDRSSPPSPSGSAQALGGAPSPAPEGQPWACAETGVEFLWVPAGEFWMGSCPDKPAQGAPLELARRYDEDAYRDEQPGGLVAIERGYWIAKHPVTRGLYARFWAERGAVWPKVKPLGWDDPKASRAADVPVAGVDWFDALLFCHWLTDKLAPRLPAGRRILLPTEAQWERAARGTDARKYPWGDAPPTPARAVFGRAPLSSVGGCPAGASPVGCHDMAGHVWEWCLTAYSHDLQAPHGTERATRPPSGLSDEEWGLVTDPRRLRDKPHGGVEPVCAALRVLRGGSWVSAPWHLRCALRDKLHPSVQHDHGGFRVCCV